jgi:hypothetical protein
MSNLYRRPAIDASYQVSVNLIEGFQRRKFKCGNLTDDGRQVMAEAPSSPGNSIFIGHASNPP